MDCLPEVCTLRLAKTHTKKTQRADPVLDSEKEKLQVNTHECRLREEFCLTLTIPQYGVLENCEEGRA